MWEFFNRIAEYGPAWGLALVVVVLFFLWKGGALGAIAARLSAQAAAPPAPSPTPGGNGNGNGHKSNGELARIEGMLNTIAATTTAIDRKVDKLGTDLATHVEHDEAEHGRQRTGVAAIWDKVNDARERLAAVEAAPQRVAAGQWKHGREHG